MTTKEKLAVMQAFLDGKNIQCKCRGDVWRDWVLETEPEWNWDEYDYRIKPEPKLRPWKPEEVPVGALLRENCFGEKDACAEMIIKRDSIGNVPVGDGRSGTRWVSTSVLFDNYKHSLDNGKTWRPCGVEE